MNLFAYRSPTPKTLSSISDPVGAENDRYLRACQERAQALILAWGNSGALQNRHLQVLSLLTGSQPLYCPGITKRGHPYHPLYLSRDTLPWIFKAKV